MAKFALESSNTNTEKITYADLHLDLINEFTLNDNKYQVNDIRDIALDYDYRAIVNAVRNLFLTIPGQKILEPEFGINLRRFIFEPMKESITYDIKDEIYSGFKRWDSRIVPIKINVTANYDLNEYNVDLVVRLRNLGDFDVKLSGTLNKDGYTFI